METDSYTEDKVKTACIKSMKELCGKYIDAGYGKAFCQWIKEPMETTKPYGSWGNGSAMRVFPVGMLFDTMEETRAVARWTAEVSHDHPDGIKGAECVAAATFLARQGKSNKEIKEYLVQEFTDDSEFSYDFDRTIAEIRPDYQFHSNCKDSVPESILCFLESKNFEESIRLSVSLGGDSDTMGNIAGGIAAMKHEIPKSMIWQAKLRLPKDLREIANHFSEFVMTKDHLKVVLPPPAPETGSLPQKGTVSVKETVQTEVQVKSPAIVSTERPKQKAVSAGKVQTSPKTVNSKPDRPKQADYGDR